MLTALRILHLLSASVWVGGTIALVFVGVPAIRQLEGEARATAMRALGRRWRPLGWSAMAVAILSGLWLTELHGGFNRQALETDFDRTLILKSALVALLVVGALIHDYVLGPRLQRELQAQDPAAPATRRRLVVVGWFNFALTLAVPILGAVVSIAELTPAVARPTGSDPFPIRAAVTPRPTGRGRSAPDTRERRRSPPAL